MKPIKQVMINTFSRVNIPYKHLSSLTDKVIVSNRFTGESCMVTPLIGYCIHWVYQTNNAYEMGDYKIKVADFDRIRFFVADQDHKAYMICLD